MYDQTLEKVIWKESIPTGIESDIEVKLVAYNGGQPKIHLVRTKQVVENKQVSVSYNKLGSITYEELDKIYKVCIAKNGGPLYADDKTFETETKQ